MVKRVKEIPMKTRVRSSESIQKMIKLGEKNMKKRIKE